MMVYDDIDMKTMYNGGFLWGCITGGVVVAIVCGLMIATYVYA